MKRIACLVIVAATIACGGSSERTATSASKLRFAVIPKSLDLPVFNYAKIGAEREAAKRGNIDVIWRGPENADQLRQKEILESFITQKVDGIAISCLNGDFLTDTINRAMDAGIPVVTWDADAPKSKRIAFYGVDDKAAGRIMAQEAVKLLGGKGKVALLTSLGATNLLHRVEGMREVLDKEKDIKVVETFDIKEDPVRCGEIMASAGKRYPDLGAWLSAGGWPVFTRNALASIDPAKTKVISFDTIPPAPELLKEGKVQALIGQKYFGWGSEPVKILAGIKAGKMPPATFIDSGLDVVTAANVDDYVAKWKKLENP
jgi:ribose transport system substrate-binding protein